ncbi:MAG: hypothetical protein A2137_04725 [Chloroflexi bacterium RBG_16_58_8]|nr:MAG: hypothetical protein A2137_04725 [Chloroflexi bacterium RBG_16_58_8]
MVEIRYGTQYEVTDLAGKTISEAREHFRAGFGIPEKAQAKLNGNKVKGNSEIDTVLNDDDRLTFAVSRSRTPFLVGALLLALAVTGGVFAATADSATVTLGISAQSDLATVTAFAGPTWTVHPRFKGTIPNGKIFQIAPQSFTGDLLATLYITNGNELVNVYNALVMKVQIFDGAGANATQPAYLTLENSALSLAFNNTTPTGNYTVNITSGYYSNFRWVTGFTPSGEEDPIIFLEVTQASP